jgi:phosphomannomutase
VIAGIEAALQKGKKFVCGWEPNGGFLTGSDLVRNGATLKALLTRDSVLPILAALFAAADSGLSLVHRFDRLPKRFSRAGLLKQFPRAVALKIVAHFSPLSPDPQEAELLDIRNRMEQHFTRDLGFGTITHVDYTDGIRILFDNSDLAHVRPSGNADEFRIYAVADTQQRADAIVAMGVAEPDGILRSMEKFMDK